MVPLVQMSLNRQLPAATPRPPTPPRESDHNHESKPGSFFGRVFSKDATAKPTSSITPSSSAESPSQASGTVRKRVGWDDEATSSPNNQPVPTSGERKPIKSILKPYNGVNVSSFNLGSLSKQSPSHAYANLAAMLESIAQQMAGEDRTSRMDAYTALSGAIKSYDNVPDVRALKDKMGLFQQFMRRDLVAKTPAGSLDTPLVINDLVLLSSFLHKPAIAELFSSEFSAHIVDHAIKTFEDPGQSKDVSKHLMFIIAQQSFPAKVMNIERVGRLIAALHEIENFVKGKSIVIGRLNIYRNLIRKSRPCMQANTDWIEDLFSDILSNAKDTRTHAIELGLEASLVLGTESKVSRAAMEFFQREHQDETSVTKYGEYFAKRMQAMVQKKQEGGSPSVPQIWSIVVLFLRCRPRQFEQWAFMSDWLKVIQHCFNCSDQQTKLEANLAWNRFIFATTPDEKTSPSTINILSVPLLEQLKRKGKASGKARKATLSSVCILLYYSLQPNSPATQLDQYWDSYVQQIVGGTLISHNSAQNPDLARQDRIDACRILKGLFDSTTPRPWKETRAMDFNTIDSGMETSELPSLDSKWLRKSASRVFALMNPLLEHMFWDLADDGAIISTVWDAYITSIAAPAVKEIKVANETMACVASIFNFLYRIWHTGPKNLRSLPPSSDARQENFLSCFTNIVLSVIDKLGVLPFTEKLLSIGNQDTFVVISTPSHRPRNSRGEVQCPLHHLFLLLTNICPGLEYDDKFALMMRRIITPFVNARPSSKSQMELIKELLHLLPTDPEFNEPSKLIWQVLADLATRAADTRDVKTSDTMRTNDQPLGVDYRNALEILEFCIQRSPRVPLPGWRSLFEALVNSATLDAGDAGRAIAVIEPLARVFTAKFSKAAPGSEYGLAYCRMVVSKANYPKDRQALDAARRTLWGAATGGVKPSDFDPYTELYTCLQVCLERSYASFNKDQALEYSDVLSATTGLLGRCPNVMLYSVYLKLQSGIACWILDDQSKFSGGNVYSHAITSLWAEVCAQVPNMRHTQGYAAILNNLELLLVAGLESKHRTIVNGAIQLWNTTFGDCQERLEYPANLKAALLRLRPIAELQLPFFPEAEETEPSEEHRQPVTFEDTQYDESISFFEPSKLNSLLGKEALPILGANKRSREETPDMGSRNAKKRVPTPKLRHDDSQIQFEAIDSSPMVDEALESQLLTDRQREVKERQKLDAAMFPDLRSSPRAKGTPSSGELPLHRSSSRAPSVPSPGIARQTTPTLILQAEEDDFVNSSPTPTRANTSEPPSSPPEAATKRAALYEDESDIPSSPPEMGDDLSNVNTTPLYPSAQIDPYAIETTRTVSTYEDTPRNSIEPKTSSASEIQAQPGKTAKSTSEVQLVDIDSGDKQSQGARGASTDGPLESHSDPEAVQQSRETPVFHDALTSPVSSEPAENAEVFEDAISSPRIEVRKTRSKKASSPIISDFDDSSLLRIAKQYDEGSGRPRRSTRFPSGKGDEPADLAAPIDSPSKAKSTDSQAKVPQTMATNLYKPSKHRMERRSIVGKRSHSSPLPSLIPETPGIKGAALVDEVEENLNPEETIIVETPDDYEPYTASRRKRTRAPFTRIRTFSSSPGSRKRKLDDNTRAESEVPDSQGVKREEAELASPKDDSPSKRRKQRSQRRSRLSMQTDMSPEPESQPSQSFSSLGIDDSEVFDSTSDALASFTEKVEEPKVVRATQKEEPVEDVSIQEISTPVRRTRAKRFEEPTDMSAQVIADTTFDDSDVLGSSAAHDKSLQEQEDISSMVEQAPIPSVESQRGASAPASIEGVGLPTMRSMREKLQGLISELSTAILTREEVNVFEDMFMDAKEKLYGAARRGRADSS